MPSELPSSVLSRRAVVYVRQSTTAQVRERLESRRRHYDLTELARAYGFREVEVIDDDLGRSAASKSDRTLRGHEISVGAPPRSLGSRRTGMVNVNVEPCPTWLLTQIRPPWSSMNFLEGQPQPGALHFLICRSHLPELLEHRLLILGRDAHPVSVTEISASPLFIAARTSIRPPSGVNLRALESRFNSTCLTFRSSARITPSRSSTLRLSVMPRRPARSLTRISAFSIALGRSNSAASSSMRPASILDRSRMSLMRESRCCPEA
jgi:hypothetical protein